MLTTEVVKGLIAGKVYRWNIPTPFDTWQEIKVRDRRFFTRSNAKTEWGTGTFTPSQLEANWEEVTEWQEIDWKEAVDCHNEGIPLQRYRLGEWIDELGELNLETVGFVYNSKWRKKV